MLEHLKITRVEHFFKECFRVLKPDGIFRITVPDLELVARKYVEKDHEFFEPYLKKGEVRRASGNKKFWMVRSYGGVLNMFGTPYYSRHRWFYDYDTIKLCAEEVGFKNIVRQFFEKSQAAALSKMDREHRQFETVYVEMTK